jgi:Ca2+-binding EF-hand superfamily protein
MTRYRRSRFAVLAIVVLALSGNTALSQEGKPAAGPVSPQKELPRGMPVEGDAYDLVLLGVSGPLFLRLHVQVDGLGYQTVWQRFVAQYFDYVDRDGDGSLSSGEADGGISSLSLAGGAAVMDAGARDGRITREEWGVWLKSRGEPRLTSTTATLRRPRSATPGGRMMPGRTPGNELWEYLDVDRDRLVTRDEVAAALGALGRLDLNDDEMIDGEELRPYRNAMAEYYGGLGDSESAAPNALSVLSAPTTAGSARALASALIARYDGRAKSAKSVKDRKLSAEELGVDADLLKAADADGDGLLDFEELGEMARGCRPQLTLVVRLGGDSREKKARVAIVGESAESARPEPRRPVELRVEETGALLAQQGSLQLRFNAAPDRNRTASESQYKRVFEEADRDNNKYLDQNELRNNFGDPLALVDRDNNGMVFLEELVAYYARQMEIISSRIAVRGTDHGKMIYDVLDADQNGQLSQRELANAWNKLEAWDKNGDGRLAEDEVPHQFSITIGRGSASDATRVVTDGQKEGAQKGTKAPVWFMKMDRNRDGDISPREFLGKPEVFARLDANRDGLIDLQEAAGAK